jgi:hypothetical protein
MRRLAGVYSQGKGQKVATYRAEVLRCFRLDAIG